MQNKTNSNLLEENEKLKERIKKEEETVGFMFKRTKELSALISEFHMTYIKKIDLNQTQENILSFNSASQKL